MAAFLRENWGTVLVAAVLATLVALLVFRMVRARRQGKSSCGCGGCAGCALHDRCHGCAPQDPTGKQDPGNKKA